MFLLCELLETFHIYMKYLSQVARQGFGAREQGIGKVDHIGEHKEIEYLFYLLSCCGILILFQRCTKARGASSCSNTVLKLKVL